MSKRRVMMTVKELQELQESMNWCQKHGVNGMLEFYVDHLMFMVRSGKVDSIDVDTFVGNGPWTREMEEQR